MKILVIGTTVFPLPPKGYSGLELLVWQWSTLFHQAGHTISVVCPEGSWLPDGIEMITVPLRCSEETAYQAYKERMLDGDWDAIFDSSWNFYSVLAEMESKKNLPVMRMYHSDPRNLGARPPIPNLCMVSPSRSQSDIISLSWQTQVRIVPHGVDTELYKPDATKAKSDRYLFLARYTPEKGFLELTGVAKNCGVGLDAYGDTEIIASQEYAQKCFAEADGKKITVNKGISREETAIQYQTHKAMLHWPNFIEIWGLTITEAMSCGCPVVARNHSAPAEQILHGKTGFLCNTLKEMEHVIRDDLVSTLNPKACRTRAKEFDISKSAKGHLELLEDLANGIRW